MLTRNDIAEMIIRQWPYKEQSTKKIAMNDYLQLTDKELMEKFEKASKGTHLIRVGYNQFTIN